MPPQKDEPMVRYKIQDGGVVIIEGDWRGVARIQPRKLYGPCEEFDACLRFITEAVDSHVRLREENRVLATIIDALITLDLNGEKILAAIKDDLTRGLDGNGHLGFVDLLIQGRKAEVANAD